MAEGVLSGVAANIISWAGAQAAEEIKLIFGAKGELRKLTETVSTIKAVLLDAEDQQYKNREVSVWLEKLSDILFDADDLLDGCHTEALRRQIMTKDKKAKKVRMFFSESKQLAFRLKMGHKIKAINERIAAIKDVKALHLQDRPIEGETRHKERDSTHSFVPSEEVIGRDNDKAEVIKRLMDTNVEGNVLPIVGIGGIGKTALAQLVFNDERIQEYFELKIWVCVSDHFEVKVIVEKILQCLTKEKPSVTEMEPLKTKLKEKIDTKRYLLVLDDGWNENPEKWSELKRLLKGGGEGSRILVTTRSRNVARMMFQGDPFNLEELGEEQSMDLFKKNSFSKW